jgi:ACR3 family arsenite efflux pump ArsB
MKTFRRTAFFILAVLMLGITLIEFGSTHPSTARPSHDLFHPLMDGIWILSPFLMLIWCARFLRSEPSLAEAGILGVIAYAAASSFITAT